MSPALKKPYGMINPDSSSYNFDISTRKYNETGILGFYWPISYRDRRCFADEYLRSVKKFFADLNETEQEDANILRLLQSHLFVICATIAQSSHLHSDADQNSITYPKARAQCWSSSSTKEWLNNYEKKLFSNLDEPQWKRFARYVKYFMRLGKIRAFPLHWSSKKFPIITGNSPLLELYLEEKEIHTVSYISYSEWFYTLSQSEQDIDVSPIEDALIEKYIACVPEICGQKISSEDLIALKDFIRNVSRQIKLYLYRFNKNPNMIPNIFLSGSMGMLLNGIIGLSVKNNGGKVINFDHGYSCNIWSNSTTALVETQISHEFYTFSPYSAKAVKNNISHYCFSNTPPQIYYYQPKEKHSVIVNKKTNNKEKTIMFVQALFIGDQGELDPIMPDVVAADWQVRLFHHIRSLGYNIILKPHPLSGTQLPDKVIKDLNIHIVDEPFEKICMEADILMFDYALSTTFHLGMLTNKPMIYFHFSDSSYPEKLQTDLDKRIEIVNGFYDDNNRAQIHWETLINNIDSSYSKNSHTITNKVLPNFNNIPFEE